MTATGPTSFSAPSAAGPAFGPAFDVWREVRRTYGFPLTMFALAIIPGLNFTYSGHGGPCWFILPLCAPYIFFRALIKIIKSSNEMSRPLLKFFAATIPLYVALAYPLSWAATTSLRLTFGWAIQVWTFMAIMISPFPYWYFS